MKVAMLGRIGLMENGGGDKVQIVNTAKELTKLGVQVDVLDSLDADLSTYDLVHIFQLDWNSEAYFYAKEAKRLNKPIVLSPIHHLLEEVERFDETYVFDYRRIAKLLFSNQFHRDVFKNIFRSIFDRRKLLPTFVSMIVGLRKMHIKALQMADVVLVQTQLEAQDLQYVYDLEFKWLKAPNGVGEQFLTEKNYKNILGMQNYVICVGRIEPRKNQLSIINAVQKIRNETNLSLNLVLIGDMHPKTHYEYTKKFKNALKNNKWITHISKVDYQDMPSYYKYAKVCVSASWFESTGLTLLEGLFCGTNVVAASKPTKEYLEDYAIYCDPGNIESIKNAIIKAYNMPRPVVDPKLKKEYTWENAAKKTLEVYQDILKTRKAN